jgi:RimJ/RimL family protein N-acetyltransferase
VLETARLFLRLPRLDDAEALLEFVGDEEVMRRIGDEPGGREKAEAFVDRWIKRWERNEVGQFIVERDHQLIGRVGLVVWDRRTWETSAYGLAGEHAQEELGWALLRRAWGYGYATEAAQAVKHWCHEERGIKHLVSLIAPDNVRSQRVAEKLGARLQERIETAVGPTDVWAYPVEASGRQDG